MRLITALLIGLLPAMTGGAFAAGDAGAGKAAYAACSSCHGANAEGNATLAAPRLAHLDTVYIIAQLEKFKAGIRGGADASDGARQMAGMAATLANEQAILDVATYIGTLAAAPSEATLNGDAAVGADYYNQICGACHGATAQGNAALNSPALAGGDDWYLLAQLNAFRSGTRGSHADDKTGRQMRAMANLIPDDKTAIDVVVFVRDASK